MSEHSMPRRSDAVARRERLIDTAITLFRDTGHRVPLETIAEQAGVGIATLYRNFSDREALKRACTARLCTQVIELQRATIQALPDNPAQVWHNYARSLADMGVGLILSTFTPDDPSSLEPELVELLIVAERLGDTIIELARKHELVGDGINHQLFFLGLVTVTRPPAGGISQLLPSLTDALLDIYLVGLTHPVGPVGQRSQ